jgi:hypothetical protein
LGTASTANGSPVPATWTDRMVASQVPDIGSSWKGRDGRRRRGAAAGRAG